MEELLSTAFKGKKKVDISRFKGLGEMPSAQLRETTMHPSSRTLLRVAFDASGEALTLEPADAPAAGRGEATDLVERLLGRKPEHHPALIQDNAKFSDALDVWNRK